MPRAGCHRFAIWSASIPEARSMVNNADKLYMLGRVAESAVARLDRSATHVLDSARGTALASPRVCLAAGCLESGRPASRLGCLAGRRISQAQWMFRGVQQRRESVEVGPSRGSCIAAAP